EQVLDSLEKRKDLSPKYIHPQKRLADMIVRFYPPETNMQETGGQLNAQVVLKPTVPHPDLTDVLQRGSNGSNPALRLNLARYEGTPADFMEIAGNLVETKAHDLISVIQHHMPADCRLNEAMLGQYLSGLEARRSLPLALTQYLIAYHMVTAGLTIEEMQS
ncbi:MAG: hypothetical protein KC434_16780, partial [Anaerolineales bacterium]|nr:hypothetical protein [Anaerolineales bacterium]